MVFLFGCSKETIKNKLTNNSTYQLIITKNNQHIENISSLKEVASIIKKYSTYKVYIKPCKIISSFLYYEEKSTSLKIKTL